MHSKPDTPSISPIVAETTPGRLHRIKMLHSPRPESFKLVDRESNDVERRHGSSDPDSSTIDLNHYRLINKVWHFFSVDPGPKCKS